jgi:hypothetical protein
MRRHERTHTASSAFEAVPDDPGYGNVLGIKYGCPLCDRHFTRSNELEVPLIHFLTQETFDMVDVLETYEAISPREWFFQKF